ncbi:hypothetical protein BU17DRAFT_95625 [Hysterangium stoloniferum]|nr:hypothetical protein BU17DRAFT_95625 [Hysterangium stoloniferum]
MASLFGFLFSCCLRPKPETTDRTPLLQDGETPIYVPRDTVSTDRQKLKDRLSNIVRAKEGYALFPPFSAFFRLFPPFSAFFHNVHASFPSKMVNINDDLPFNFQDRDFPTPSSSRVRAESSSPHPSVRTAETSTTSRSGCSSRPRGGKLNVPKEPALGVRLVRGREGNSRGVANRGRLGRFGEERGLEVVRDERINGVMEFSDSTNVPNVRITEPGDSLPEITPLEDADLVNIGNQLREGWKIKDAGPISRGWGD